MWTRHVGSAEVLHLGDACRVVRIAETGFRVVKDLLRQYWEAPWALEGDTKGGAN